MRVFLSEQGADYPRLQRTGQDFTLAALAGFDDRFAYAAIESLVAARFGEWVPPFSYSEETSLFLARRRILMGRHPWRVGRRADEEAVLLAIEERFRECNESAGIQRLIDLDPELKRRRRGLELMVRADPFQALVRAYFDKSGASILVDSRVRQRRRIVVDQIDFWSLLNLPGPTEVFNDSDDFAQSSLLELQATALDAGELCLQLQTQYPDGIQASELGFEPDSAIRGR